MGRSSKGTRLLLFGILLVVIDQVIKVLVKTNMTLGQSIPVLGNWFQLLFVENKGMAFGMAFGGVVGKYLLTVFRLVLFGVLCWWISRLLKRENPVPTGVLVGLTLITAGAFGNIIDCLCYGLVFSESTANTVATLGSYAPLMQGKVVDMFYFPLFELDWPSWIPVIGGKHFEFFSAIFNFADAAITIGVIWLIVELVFFQKNEKKPADEEKNIEAEVAENESKIEG